MLRPSLGELDLVLEIAPSRHSTRELAALGARHHLRLDIGYDRRLVDVMASLTQLPHRTGSVDLLVCYHVLEHVPDDRAATAEIARVLSSTGTALVQVPFRRGVPTEEDLEADEVERLRRFGQRDHVRVYGDDFEDRLVAAGLSVHRISPLEVLGPEVCEYVNVKPEETVWLLRRGDAPTLPPWPDTAEGVEDVSSSLAALGGHLVSRLAKTETQLARVRDRAEQLQAREQRLRTRARRAEKRAATAEAAEVPGARRGLRAFAGRARRAIRRRLHS